ncbi:pleckstrin homology-like domain family B member 2 isoform X2 [Hemiscyllium ocellatum]|uniref:pleckstrin homology-like domain family B member 2 isoform X2 n=1 Tax=Hemiscyllium ocellatum TaxID=170820 RepID=UPI002965D553|nr:pleckstrin homology-like domain family B member 2 isoform X2 [Hemiscyllium ocellatum]
MIDLARGLANEVIEKEKGPEGAGAVKETSLCHWVPEDTADRKRGVGHDIENTLTLSVTALSQTRPASGQRGSWLEGEQREAEPRNSPASLSLSDPEREQEEIDPEGEMELALVHGELETERKKLVMEQQFREDLRSQIAGLDQTLQLEKDKARSELERARRRVEAARRSLGEAERSAEGGLRGQHREQPQEEAEALEVAQKGFEELEFQWLERLSSLEEEKETQNRWLQQELSLSQKRVADREETVRNLQEQLREIKEQVNPEGRRRMTLSMEEGTMFNLEEYSSGMYLEGANPMKQEPANFRNSSGSISRRRRNSHGGWDPERPVSLHEEAPSRASMQLLSLVTLHRSRSFQQEKLPFSTPPRGTRLSEQLPELRKPRTEPSVKVSRSTSLHSNGYSLQTLMEMENKLRAALAEKERLLQAKDAQRREQVKTEADPHLVHTVTPVGTPPSDRAPDTDRAPIALPTFDLRAHVEACGHAVEGCRHLTLTAKSCRGFLTKMGGRIKTWRKRWFVFDVDRRWLAYFTDKEETKLKGVIYFQALEEIYFDHLRRASKSPNPPLTFCLKTYDRLFYMVAPTDVTLRIWMEVILTAVEGNVRF